MSKLDFEKLFGEFANIKIGVLGDVMLDTYWWGQVERISPEAPVPIVSLDRKEYRIGGAGNVALNLACLGARTSIITVVGNDEEGKILRSLFEENNIRTAYMLPDASRITTSKSRIISRNQQMMRLDAEITSDLSAACEEQLLAAVAAYLSNEKPNVVILEDYNKGTLTERVISETIALCKKHGVITSVDPKRKHFLDYRGVDIFKPNLKEVKEGLNLLIDEVNEKTLRDIHHELKKRLDHLISFITLSEKGVFYQREDQSRTVRSHFRNIADVSGAGDTVIAVASLVYAATGDINLMAEIANIAGGLVCEEVGTVAINKERLLEECRLLLS
ncbi:MAG TPA: PfkB family carbohydrate kinase [Flavitalea sp.]|nr:PfkB family carbohydrate kinase [Flavitalea sp.]